MFVGRFRKTRCVRNARSFPVCRTKRFPHDMSFGFGDIERLTWGIFTQYFALHSHWQRIESKSALIHYTLIEQEESYTLISKMQLLTVGAHAHRGLRYLVGVSVCQSTLILALQATRRLMCDTKSFSTTTAQK